MTVEERQGGVGNVESGIPPAGIFTAPQMQSGGPGVCPANSQSDWYLKKMHLSDHAFALSDHASGS